jgi:hypothetical protein
MKIRTGKSLVMCIFLPKNKDKHSVSGRSRSWSSCDMHVYLGEKFKMRARCVELLR